LQNKKSATKVKNGIFEHIVIYPPILCIRFRIGFNSLETIMKRKIIVTTSIVEVVMRRGEDGR